MMLRPNSISLSYYRALRLQLNVARELIRLRIMPILPELVARGREHRGDHFDAQAPEKRINTKMAQIEAAFKKKYDTAKLADLARTIGQRTSEMQKQQLYKTVQKDIGVPLEPKMKPKIESFTASNVALIKTIPATYFAQVESTLISGISEGKLASDIAADIAERFDVADSRAQLIARDQVGKFYSEVNAARQEENGITKFIWSTAGDNRVRDEHAVLDGEEFTWEDGAPGEGFPGEQILCRCVALPVIDDSVLEG